MSYTIIGTFTAGTVDLSANTLYQSLIFDDTRDDKTGIYRKTLTNELIFVKAAYDTIMAEYALGTCNIPIAIKYNGVTKYSANIKLNTSATNINRLLCTISAKLDNNDAYTCFLKNYDTEINVLLGTTKYSVQPFFGTIQIETVTELPGGSPPTWPLSSPRTATDATHIPANGWTIIKNQLNGVVNVSSFLYRAETNIVTTYAREFVSGSTTPPGDGWLTVSGGFARRVSRIYNASKSQIFDPDVTKIVQIFDVVGLDDMGAIVNIPNGVRLNDILTTFIPCSLTIKSDFFGINADGTHPTNTPYSEALENLQDMLWFQKSDVKRPTASNVATAGKTSYKKIMEVLEVVFEVKYRIAGTELRIEHYSYFNQFTGLNLAAPPYAGYILGKVSTTYDATDETKSERWVWMETVSNLFTSVPIRYPEDCLLSDASEEIVHTAEDMNSDLLYIQANPNRIDDKGFVPIAAYRNGSNYYLVQEQNLIDTNLYPNSHMAWANLMDHYHRYNRLYPTGKLNGTTVTFDSSRRRKVGEQIEIILSDASYWSIYDSGSLIETPLGIGEVTKATYDSFNCRLSLNLRY